MTRDTVTLDEPHVGGWARGGRSATDEELWELDADLAALAANPAGTPDVDTVAGVAHLEGGPELAAWLAAVDISSLGEFDLVEVVAGFERVASWARSRAAHAAAHLSRRPVMNPYWPPHAGAVSEPCAASTELSLRLGTSRWSAARLVSTGRALDGPMQRTGEALASGSIDWFKALAITESLDGVPWQVAGEVEAVVLRHAPRRTHSQLRRDVARALAEVDPQDAQERHGRAVQRRRVERPRPLPDGMASVRAVIPAEAAVRLDATLQAAAVAARAGGDARTVDQLRADALDAMGDVAWSTGWIGEGRPGALRVGRSAGRRAQIMVTVGIGTLLGLDERPAELDGYGPIGADVARSIAEEGTWRRLLVDPANGAVLDVGRTRYRPPEAMADLVRARHPYCVIPSCSVAASQCELDHTIPFDHQSQGEVSSPLQRQGVTAAHNLGPLCRSHHLLKTHGGFRLVQLQGGTFTLRTPTGHRYTEKPPRPPGVPGPSGISEAAEPAEAGSPGAAAQVPGVAERAGSTELAEGSVAAEPVGSSDLAEGSVAADPVGSSEAADSSDAADRRGLDGGSVADPPPF